MISVRIMFIILIIIIFLIILVILITLFTFSIFRLCSLYIVIFNPKRVQTYVNKKNRNSIMYSAAIEAIKTGTLCRPNEILQFLGNLAYNTGTLLC